MPWKMNEDGSGFVADEKGNPIWIDATGKESPADFLAMGSALQKASKEAAERKDELRKFQQKYAKLGEIEDLDTWLAETEKAREMVAHAPDSAKALEEQVAARVKAATDGFNSKLSAKDSALAAREKELADVRRQLEDEKVMHSFYQSSFVRDKTSSPTTVFELLGPYFGLKDGKIVGYEDREHTQEIFGDDGAVASFDMAVAKLLEARPDKGILYKGSSMSGGGASPSSHAGGSANPWDKKTWNATEQMRIAAENRIRAIGLMQAAGHPVPAGF